MKKVLVMVALVMASVIVYAFNDSRETNQGKKEVTGNGEVVVMDKDMFLKDVFDYEIHFHINDNLHKYLYLFQDKETLRYLHT